MKKVPVFLAALLLLCVPVLAAGGQAAEIAEPTAALWMCIPFAGILLCIAVMPLVAPAWWERHQPIVVGIWSLLFLIPFAVVNGAGASVQSALECLVDDYLTFIVLLFGLFCVAGNITLEGDLAGSPRVNVALLLFGTMLSIKPIMHTSDEGKLTVVGKARGRKSSLNTLIDTVGRLGINLQDQVMFICQADCQAEAETVAAQLKQRYGVKEVYINYIGPVIGSHTGPNTMGLFFVGTER